MCWGQLGGGHVSLCVCVCMCVCVCVLRKIIYLFTFETFCFEITLDFQKSYKRSKRILVNFLPSFPKG